METQSNNKVMLSAAPWVVDICSIHESKKFSVVLHSGTHTHKDGRGMREKRKVDFATDP